MNHLSFPSIEQYRTIIKRVNDTCERHGISKRPVVTFQGTVKLHGTNAGVQISNGQVAAQSRTAIITTENDNCGFAQFVAENTEFFNKLEAALNPFGSGVVVYGEWCGQGIQKGVAIAQLPKRFVIFAARRIVTEGNHWIDPIDLAEFCLSYPGITKEGKVTSVWHFPTYMIKVDFANPAEAQNKLVEITNGVEQECPIASALGGKRRRRRSSLDGAV